MKKIEIKSLYELSFLSGVQYSPDGKNVMFAKAYADEDSNGYKSDIYLYNKETGIKKMTGSGDVRSAQWFEDKLLFSSRREKAKEGTTSILALDIGGGEAYNFLTVPERGARIIKIADDFILAAVSRKIDEKGEKVTEKKDPLGEYTVITELPFWFNGRGVVDKTRSAIVLLDKEGNVTKQLTSDAFSAGQVVISDNNRYIAYTGQEYLDMTDRESGLFVYDVKEDKTYTIVENGKMGVGGLMFFDDDTLFYEGTTFEWPGRSPNYFVLNLNTKASKTLPFADAPIGSSVGTDASYGAGASMRLYNGKMYMLKTDWSHTALMEMDKDGNIKKLFDANGSISCFDINENGVYMIAMLDMKPGELYHLDINTGELTQITSYNEEFVKEHFISKPEYFTFTSDEGVELEGFVIKPYGYEEGKKYPAVFEIHGGPKVAFGAVFHHEMQCLASKGYFVFYTNPRGSDGRGEDFANITEKLGYDDYRDLMAVFDEVLKRYPDICEKRVGIAGGSYGGFMCNWMVGHTDRFAAAASQRSISNYLTKALTTDIGFNHNMSQLGTNPWKDFDTFWEHSPLKHAPNAVTPTLFIQSDEDYRCWMSDAIQMYTALKLNNVDTKVALFKGENHELSRSGKPKNRESRLMEIISWFDKYMGPDK